MIQTFDGEILGTLALYHDAPRIPEAKELEAIDLLARTASILIGRPRADEARDAAVVQARASDLAAQEMRHRVMNSFQVLQGLVAVQAKASPSSEVRIALVSVSGRLQAMAAVHRLLLKGVRENVETIDLAAYLPELIDFVGSAFTNAGEFALEVNAESVQLPADQVSGVGLIATELVLNSLKLACPDGRPCQVNVSLERLGDKLRLAVYDNAVGLPAEAEKPGKTGLGMKLVHSLARQLGGTVQVDRTPPGVCFQVIFPVIGTQATGTTPVAPAL